MDTRRNKILRIVNERGIVHFQEIIDAFPNVSEMTLRKDLKFLDAQKALVRIHGGARSLDNVNTSELPLALRLSQNTEQKYCIAQKAKELIKENSVIMIDSGSTSAQLARVFPNKPCTVFTSSLSAAISLCELDKVELYMFAGRVKGESLSIRGSRAIDDISNLKFDIAFFSCSGFTKNEGFSTRNEECWTMERQIIRHSKNNVLLMDSSKDGKSFPYVFAKAEDIQILISDYGLSEDTAQYLTSNGVKVL